MHAKRLLGGLAPLLILSILASTGHATPLAPPPPSTPTPTVTVSASPPAPQASDGPSTPSLPSVTPTPDDPSTPSTPPAPATPADPTTPTTPTPPSLPTVPAVARVWPVGSRPPVVRGWDPPATPYARGHRGVDLAAAPGAPVRAVATGRVSFAGRVAGRGVVAVELADTGEPPLRTTYEPVRASVRAGDRVVAGQVVGAVEPADAHCSGGCLHWGLLRGETYLDPLSLLPPWLRRRLPARLLPVIGVPLP
ncbi:M23 family metallopeptidase [Streptomyces sp. IBSBF 2807]|nr:M23 family metallopeptidase [Streptomyces hilarionis]